MSFFIFLAKNINKNYKHNIKFILGYIRVFVKYRVFKLNFNSGRVVG